MSNTVIKIENLSKIYRLGEVGTGTLSHDLNRWFRMNLLGQDDPYAKIGHINDRTQKAEKGELVAALRDINLEVKEGEVLGIIGKNGAGKSTLLKLLSRVTSPTTGSIKVKGRLASLLEVGTGFHPEMTGRENIYMNGTIMGMRRWEIDKKLDEIVEFAGVAKYLDTPTKRYSSGMTVRLGFAIAAHLEPEILVVDEVLAVGDAEFQKKAIGKMQDVSTNDGRTVLFVSHNMDSVKKVCSNGIILKNGLLTYQDSIDNVIERYLETELSEISSVWINPNSDLTDDLVPKKISFDGSESKNVNFFIKHKSNAKFKFSFLLNKKITALTIGYSLFDIKDNLLFRCLNTDLDDKFNDKLSLGDNTIETLIPLEILNKGEYYIAIDISIFRKKVLFSPYKKRIGIHFVVEDEFGRSEFWDIKRAGIFAPSIKWEISQ